VDGALCQRAGARGGAAVWAALQAGEFIADAAAAAGTYRKQGTRWVATCGGVRPRRGRRLKGRCLTFAEREEIALAPDAYVSAAHRDDPASGCGVVALGTDMPRVGGLAQEAYRVQVERYLAHLQPLLGGDDDEARRRATVTLSAMVGAVMIARALGSTPGSDEILRDVREAVRERRLL
jgi:hypothetical protein